VLLPLLAAAPGGGPGAITREVFYRSGPKGQRVGVSIPGGWYYPEERRPNFGEPEVTAVRDALAHPSDGVAGTDAATITCLYGLAAPEKDHCLMNVDRGDFLVLSESAPEFAFSMKLLPAEMGVVGPWLKQAATHGRPGRSGVVLRIGILKNDHPGPPPNLLPQQRDMASVPSPLASLESAEATSTRGYASAGPGDAQTVSTIAELFDAAQIPWVGRDLSKVFPGAPDPAPQARQRSVKVICFFANDERPDAYECYAFN
jgi:hypothetical protein